MNIAKADRQYECLIFFRQVLQVLPLCCIGLYRLYMCHAPLQLIFWRQAFLCRICRFELRIEAHESWPLLQVVGTTQVETPETGEIQNPILLVQALVEAGSS